ncbi:M56 family metallopeptidase [Paenibacillus ginsengihumi]|uniref:M56 family metallopeptidase n=1 Tax=Paenibacillus ginsengihumi TaxID=431596 RepID=UPI0003733C23|nr:M56 family metallopeptidase [Paenibacillus ginsengihumi]
MDIVQMSFSASVLTVVVVIIRAFALHKLPKKTFLVLWGVVICRLLLPLSVPFQFSFYTGIETLKNMFIESTDVAFPAGMPSVSQVGNIPGIGQTIGVGASTASFSWMELVWLTGICAFALFFITVYIKCRREFQTSLPVNNDFIAQWLREHPLRRPMQIRQSDRIKAPLTYGAFRPVILLPKKTDWTDEARLKVILAHEFVHIKRFDTLTKLLLAAAVCVHWFNPFVWLMYVMANRDIELACDEAVLRKCGESTKAAYALALIGLAEKNSGLVPLINHFSKNAIEERIVAIMKTKKTSLMGMVFASAMVGGTIAVFATNAASATDNRQENGNVTVVQEAAAEEAAYAETPEGKAELFAVYEPYGLTYNKSTDQLFYKGELVRYFADYYPIDEDSSAGNDYLNEKGTIDVHGVRDLSKLPRHADSSIDPSGKLIGVEPYSQAEFNARDIEKLKNPPQTDAVSVDESSMANTSAGTAQEFSNEASSTASTAAYSAGDDITPDELAKIYAVYEPFGVTYDKKKDRLYYNGKLVREFIDILSSNGEELESGKFEGSMRQMNRPDGKVDIKAVRDYKKLNAEGEGKLIGIEVVN